MTNLEYLRTLSAEELAKIITSCGVCEKVGITKCCDDCEKRTADWLNQESKIKLQPCPFCGGEAEIRRAISGGNSYYGRCAGCGVETPYCDNYSAVAEAWNRRAE